MASPSSSYATTTFLIIIILIMHHMLYQVSCTTYYEHIPASSPSEEVLHRVGSVPPICHNKCNGCHPCIPVPVSSAANKEGFLFEDHNSYSNYKPLGWKCRCGDHFFDP
ncbi:hypothetical protein PIB30_016878 [Stylosanthes scabra]|uniref:Epidermal patterning factor-like protein n=1 Tax=Stylosanthes scabra TaxID=79078 RepID=A0ABU6V5N9_9FABA|nr:hypothetical protein [Stylosanthes scabra]